MKGHKQCGITEGRQGSEEEEKQEQQHKVRTTTVEEEQQQQPEKIRWRPAPNLLLCSPVIDECHVDKLIIVRISPPIGSQALRGSWLGSAPTLYSIAWILGVGDSIPADCSNRFMNVPPWPGFASSAAWIHLRRRLHLHPPKPSVPESHAGKGNFPTQFFTSCTHVRSGQGGRRRTTEAIAAAATNERFWALSDPSREERKGARLSRFFRVEPRQGAEIVLIGTERLRASRGKFIERASRGIPWDDGDVQVPTDAIGYARKKACTRSPSKFFPTTEEE